MATSLAASSALSLQLPSSSRASSPSSTTTARVTPLGSRRSTVLRLVRSGASPTGSVAEEEAAVTSSGTEQGSPGDDGASEVSTSQPARSFSPTACQACGKEEKVGGCNGEGRILGGLSSVPGFGWFPIKAYRPCPAFVDAGGRYKRQGQSLEEVAFGRMGKQDNLDITERLQGGNKK
ncbi:hypothetical protein KC19_12G036000 [Ceratodon purpureus]|uniref:Uncharacterized protein n=1 Tax=Ceratodon purpureus TaxID=3225 RepID=A0A8T0G5P1_CERPU|nr:hypothetical protein KC19_12G036000 [Ceratodon purpureus]